MSNSVSKSWFCVFANPTEHGFKGTPEEIVNEFVEIWTSDFPTRSCAIAYCISVDGFEHIHAVLEDTKSMRYTAIQKAFPGIHVEPTKGSKKDAEDYISKRGKFEESGEKILCQKTHGTIRANQIKNSDFDKIEELLGMGLTPNDIFSLSFKYRKYEKIIRDAYFQKRFDETPPIRKLIVNWHVGNSGTGKSYTGVKLVERYGDDHVFIVNDYRNGYDHYQAQEYMMWDEFRGQMSIYDFYVYTDVYKREMKARYSNCFTLYNYLEIISILPPDEVYKRMVTYDQKKSEPYEQFRRRITNIVYHFKKGNEYCTYTIPMSEYVDYATLRNAVEIEEEQKTIDELFPPNSGEEKPY